MLEPQAVMIANTVVDWSTYLTIAQQVIGTSITKALDKAGKKPDNMASYILTVAEFQTELGIHLKDAGGLLRHASISFLVVCQTETLYEMLEEAPLHMTTVDLAKLGWKSAIVSGNLEQWRTAVINCCSDRVTQELRLLMDKCMLCLEKAGLGEIWSSFKKTKMHDQTFKLQVKNV